MLPEDYLALKQQLSILLWNF
uniref:Uncharacterized protein n=1 Tax=Arundo donax TaxID=35708 RepID=A0A0A9CKW9_ARUDO